MLAAIDYLGCGAVSRWLGLAPAPYEAAPIERPQAEVACQEVHGILQDSGSKLRETVLASKTKVQTAFEAASFTKGRGLGGWPVFRGAFQRGCRGMRDGRLCT